MIQDNKRTLLHIELIRIIAAYFVVFNHTGKRRVLLIFYLRERKSAILDLHDIVHLLQDIGAAVLYDYWGVVIKKI